MIDMKCPSCGAGGRVPREKVNTRLVCKKCLRVFHITASGNTVLGEPAAPKDAPRAQSHRDSARRETVDKFDNVAAKLSNVKLPQIDPKVFVAIGGIVLVAALGYWFFSKQSLKQRAVEIARSFAKADMKTAVDFSLPGTEMDTIRWYNDAYKQYGELKLLFGGQEAGVTVEEQSEATGGTVPVKLIFSKEGMRFDGSIFADIFQPNPSLNKGKSSLELPLFWTKDFWGNWLLDGTKTYSGTAGP
jgi:hypothetical protein